jgi:hypothetical protein
MLGLIAGEIIGSPYSKENIGDINGIFFPLFEENRVMDPKTYRERVYRPAPGHLTEALLGASLRDGDFSGLDPKSPGEALCGAVVIGRADALLKTDFGEHSRSLEQYLRWFPEAMREDITRASDAAYRLERKLGADIGSRLGIVHGQPRPEVLSALLRGQLREDPEKDGTYIMGEGRADDAYALDAAFLALSGSRSWEEAVRRSVALGGDSSLVAALTGGLAEIEYGGVPENIAYRARALLSPEQQRRLDETEKTLRRLGEVTPESPARESGEEATLISVLSLPGRARVYAVPEERRDIESAILKLNPDSVIVGREGLERMAERLGTRRDSEGNILDGTYIDSERPEVHQVYFRMKDGKLYSPSNLPDAKGFAQLDRRIKARSEFASFREKALQIRDEQERKVGHNPEEGHLRFATAWHLGVERDRVVLYKGPTAYGEFGLDSRGRMRVDTNTVGGRFGGEYLEAALDNQRVFFRNDGPAEVLSKIMEKCLDAGFVPDGEGVVKSNMELMMEDLAREETLRKAVPISEEDLKERTAKTKARYDYGTSSEAKTFDEALYGSLHRGAVFTVGHSNLEMEEFIRNLRRNGITTVRDIRSWPQSKAFPQFCQQELKDSLEREGIRYIFNGDVMGGHVRRTEFPSAAEGVTFTLSAGGYAQRTRENAESADLTVAFAADFNTAGERLTEKAAKGKIIQIPLAGGNADPKAIASDILSCMTDREKSTHLKVNIAGNGMQTFAAHNISQNEVDAIVAGTLKELTESGVNIRSIVSGGQTGADEAGILAAKALGIPAEVHAPKGWLMRGPDGKDVFSERGFKERFAQMPPKDLSNEEMTGTEGFKKTYDEIVAAARKGERQALMCSETSPTDCHRFACLGYALYHPSLAGRRYDPVEVQHIKRDGTTISQEALERKVCRDHNIEYAEKNLPGIMRKMEERNRAPKPEARAVRPSRPQDLKRRRR